MTSRGKGVVPRNETAGLQSELLWAEQDVKRCHEALARAQQNLSAALVYLGRLKQNKDSLQ